MKTMMCCKIYKLKIFLESKVYYPLCRHQFKIKKWCVVSFIFLKLFLRKYTKKRHHQMIEIEKSPFSESVYILYYPDTDSPGRYDFYIKIRISGHIHSRFENSDIRILL